MPSNKEPILTSGLVVSAVGLVLDGLTVHGLDFSDAQTTYYRTVAAFLAPLIVWWWARRSTVTVDEANKALKTQADEPLRELKFTKGS